MSELEISALTKSFGDNSALDGVDLGVESGEVMVLLGPSGCGKTTLLRSIAGLVTPDAGSISMGGRVLDAPLASPPVRVSPEDRSVGLVFQNGVLFPHLNVARNIGFGLPRAQRKSSPRIDELLELVGLAGFGNRSCDTLSGGQAQRVALARALAPEPKVLLMDEPYSNLDAVLRTRLRREIGDIVRRTGTTTVFVTHDREEAFALGDRVAVMSEGQIRQVGSPQEIYSKPETLWTAEFVGEANVVVGSVEAGRFQSALGSQITEMSDGEASLMVRPDEIALSAQPKDGAHEGEVLATEYQGSTTLVSFALSSDREIALNALVLGIAEFVPGQRIWMTARGGRVLR